MTGKFERLPLLEDNPDDKIARRGHRLNNSTYKEAEWCGQSTEFKASFTRFLTDSKRYRGVDAKCRHTCAWRPRVVPNGIRSRESRDLGYGFREVVRKPFVEIAEAMGLVAGTELFVDVTADDKWCNTRNHFTSLINAGITYRELLPCRNT